jgi:uncharacterized protein
MRDFGELNGLSAPLPAESLWRLFLGLVLMVAVYFAFLFALFFLIVAIHGQFLASVLFLSMARGATPGGMLILLYSFAGLALGPIVAIRLVHKKRAAILFGAGFRKVAGDAIRVAWPILALTFFLLPYTLSGPGVEPGLGWSAFAAALPFAAAGLLVQVTAEELAFRGYFQNRLAARFPWRIVWAGVPSVFFGLLHWAPQTFGGASFAVVLWAVLFGWLAADLTKRTGTLGAAIGLHLAVNTGSLFIVGLKGNLDGLALWRMTADVTDPATVLPLLVVEAAFLIVAWLLARLSLRV